MNPRILKAIPANLTNLPFMPSSAGKFKFHKTPAFFSFCPQTREQAHPPPPAGARSTRTSCRAPEKNNVGISSSDIIRLIGHEVHNTVATYRGSFVIAPDMASNSSFCFEM